MESASLRSRARRSARSDLTPPKFTIDLSLPPEKRYVHLAPHFQEHIHDLTSLFDDIVSTIPYFSDKWKKRIAKFMFRRLYDDEENREIAGISKATGVEHHLLVAFNVLLDLFMGCTSGGVRTKDRQGNFKMLHFRTLDWGMDSLRKVVVELDFVRNKDGPVIASSVTYFGYVGVLTGVKKGLSISLNFRPTHDSSTRMKEFKFRAHQILVLVGKRRAISSVLRNCLLDEKVEMDVEALAQSLAGIRSTATYLIFSSGRKTVTMEKDYRTAIIRSAEDYIVVLNNDVADEADPHRYEENVNGNTGAEIAGLLDILSMDRKKCVVDLWTQTVDDRKKRGTIRPGETPYVTKSDVIRWMGVEDIANSETHYGTIMDPSSGQIIWLERYIDPL